MTVACCALCDAFVVLENAVATKVPGSGYRCAGCRESLPPGTIGPDATVSPTLTSPVHPTSWG